MPPYIHPEVEHVRDEPTQGRTMRVVLVVEKGAIPEVVSQIRKIDEIALEREFKTNMLLVELPETEISQLCELENVESISPNEQMELLN
jgi:hypothetical protein